LQKDIDDFTKLLEKEKRKLMITEDQIKQVTNEINEKQAAIDRVAKPDKLKPTRDKIDKIEIGTNVHRIKTETIKLNSTKTENQKLRA
jgi:hypothetical protein